MGLLFHYHLEAEKVMQLMKIRYTVLLVKRSRSICSSWLLHILFSVECELPLDVTSGALTKVME
jgi:hypothetical protein